MLVRYTVVIMPKAEKQLRKIPTHAEKRIVKSLEALMENLSGDVKKLTQHEPAWRLRVGEYRVLFDMEGEQIVVQAVRHRSEAYG